MNILFVCTGNISRSFLAESLLKNEIKLKGIAGISVSSAGTAGLSGWPADPRMISYLREQGIEPDEHSARELAEEHVQWADLILVMEDAHVDFITQRWPQVKGRVHKLGKYFSSSENKGEDIIDPYGKTTFHYRVSQSQITLASGNLFKKLASGNVEDKNNSG